MRIQEFENCVGVVMPTFCFGFLTHHAFHSVASSAEAHAAAAHSHSPSAGALPVVHLLSSVDHLRQALQRLVLAARVTAVFGLHKRFRDFRAFTSNTEQAEHLPEP